MRTGLLALALLVAVMSAACRPADLLHGNAVGEAGEIEAAGATPPIAVTDGDGIEGLTSLVAQVQRDVAPQRVLAVRSTRPPQGLSPATEPGLPGTSWLEIVVRGDPGEVEPQWEAAVVAGRVRVLAHAAGTHVPLGWSVVLVDDAGRRTSYGDQTRIGTPIGVAEKAGAFTETEAAITARIEAAGYHTRLVEVRGTGGAAVVTIVAAPGGLLPSEETVLGPDPDRLDWLVTFEDEDGTPFRVVGNSARTWSRSSMGSADGADGVSLGAPGPAE